jgi:hypothetical protein
MTGPFAESFRGYRGRNQWAKTKGRNYSLARKNEKVIDCAPATRLRCCDSRAWLDTVQYWFNRYGKRRME